jgi:light-regulated signal transduction histidine kinase (bacteriophytochrome)
MNSIVRNQIPLLWGLAAAIGFFVIDNYLDHLMLRLTSANVALEISDAITAILIGAMVAQLAVLHRQRQIQAAARLQRIAEMNHHVRNALQVITYWSLAEKEKRQVELVQDAVNRIQWALREVLPRDADFQEIPEKTES